MGSKLKNSYNILTVLEYSKTYKVVRGNSKEHAVKRLEKKLYKQSGFEKRGMYLGDIHILSVKENKEKG